MFLKEFYFRNSGLLFDDINKVQRKVVIYSERILLKRSGKVNVFISKNENSMELDEV